MGPIRSARALLHDDQEEDKVRFLINPRRFEWEIYCKNFEILSHVHPAGVPAVMECARYALATLTRFLRNKMICSNASCVQSSVDTTILYMLVFNRFSVASLGFSAHSTANLCVTLAATSAACIVGCFLSSSGTKSAIRRPFLGFLAL